MYKQGWLAAIFVLIFTTNSAFAIVSFGGYVPFGPATQKSEDGGRETFSFDPMIGFTQAIPTLFNHHFLPEFGFVFHGSGQDDYKKTTTYLLLDLGYMIYPRFLLRYGIGTFITKISGEGGEVVLNNGAGTATFYRPSKSQKSWNTTLNLGAEYAIDVNWAARFETFMFSPLSSTSRKMSYSLSGTYYL